MFDRNSDRWEQSLDQELLDCIRAALRTGQSKMRDLLALDDDTRRRSASEALSFENLS
ncbi:hypothetical protein [Bradyrhizobium sp. USDA 4486]